MSNKQNDHFYETLKETIEELQTKVRCSVCKKEWLSGVAEDDEFICPNCEEVINKDLDEWELQKLKNK